MSDTFYFLTKFCESNKNAVFHFDGRVDYSVNCIMTSSGQITLSVKCVKQRRNLVKVELFTEDFKLISSQLRTGNGNEVSLTFCIIPNQDVSLECNLMFIITIISHVELDHRKPLNLHDSTDVVITDGSHKIRVHEAVLSARYSVFSKILQGADIGKIITIQIDSAEALEDMVTFIYSKFIELKDVNRAQELYKSAQFYEMKDLQEACSNYMKNCTKDCALRILTFAVNYNDSELKESAIKFIVNNLRDIKSTEEWENFTNENKALAYEIVDSVTDEDTLREVMLRLAAKS